MPERAYPPWRILGLNTKNGRILTEDLSLSSFASVLHNCSRKVSELQTFNGTERAIKAFGKVNAKRKALVHAFWSFLTIGRLYFLKKGNCEDAPYGRR